MHIMKYELLLVIGIILILLALGCFVAYGICKLAGHLEEAKQARKTEAAFVGFIGFIPFGFATSKKALIVGFALLVLSLIIFFFFWFLVRYYL